MSDDFSHRLRPLEEIRDEALAKRDRLVRDICAAESGPHGGRGSRGVQVDTPQKGLAYVQGRVDADYLLPKLHALFTELGLHGVADVPPWKGEPKTDVEALQALGALLTCCKEAISAPSKPPPAKLTAAIDRNRGTATQRAALETIRKQPKGRGLKGPAILARLRKKQVNISLGTFRRNVVPYLKSHGVLNDRAHGGYYLP